MRQINPHGFQSHDCSTYVCVFSWIKGFWIWIWFEFDKFRCKSTQLPQSNSEIWLICQFVTDVKPKYNIVYSGFLSITYTMCVCEWPHSLTQSSIDSRYIAVPKGYRTQYTKFEGRISVILKSHYGCRLPWVIRGQCTAIYRERTVLAVFYSHDWAWLASPQLRCNDTCLTWTGHSAKSQCNGGIMKSKRKYHNLAW